MAIEPRRDEDRSFGWGHHDAAGETLAGRYRLVARVGSGGMGDVYRGHDLLLDRPVALKVLRRALAEDPWSIQRFKQEARAAARLTHPNVVAVYDWGNAGDDTYFMVMELVAGPDLREVLSTHDRLAPAHAAEITAAVCEALAAAHAGGVVHRDVKPENVLVAPGGIVKVADFGIAAALDRDRTAPNLTAGTLRYLAPEQLAGEPATVASDVWSAGALLYELVTGTHAAGDAARRRRGEPVLPLADAPALDHIVQRACAFDPETRFAAAEMAAELRRARELLPVPHVALADLVEDPLPVEIVSEAQTTRVVAGRRPLRPSRVLAVLAAAAAVILVAARMLPAPPFAVPRVVGLTEERAEEAARDAGATLKIADRVRGWGAPAGVVIEQMPGPGELRSDDFLRVVVAAGPPRVPVPVLVGKPVRIAQMLMRARGGEVGRVVEEHSLEPAGTVLAQTPQSGTMPFGGRIDVVVSSGPLPAAVPDTTGVTLRRAVKMLEAAGFEVVVVDTYSDDVPRGMVLHTLPQGHSQAPEGSEVRVFVSIGPRFKEIEMPDVRNLSVADATAKLEALNLRVRVVQSCGGGGTIVSETDPISGTTIHERDLVVLFVC